MLSFKEYEKLQRCLREDLQQESFECFADESVVFKSPRLRQLADCAQNARLTVQTKTKITVLRRYNGIHEKGRLSCLCVEG